MYAIGTIPALKYGNNGSRKMKKLTLFAILLLSISSSIFACGGVSDLNPAEVGDAPTATAALESVQGEGSEEDVEVQDNI